MRHIHFVQSIEPLEGGGLGVATCQLSDALQRQGRQSAVVSTCHKGYFDERAQYLLNRWGPTRVFFAPGLVRLAGELAQHSGAAFHGHGFYVYPNAVFGRAARATGTPLIYHVHGIFEPWIIGRSRWKKRIAHLLFENSNFRYARLWRALTAREADQIRAQGITNDIVVLPNGVDLAEFDSLQDCCPSDEPILLFLGRIHPKKGLDVLLRAWASLGSEREEWKLHLVGPDESGYAREIDALVRELRLAESVVRRGSVSGAEKARCVKRASAFVLSSYSEGLPMAVLEAMACRLPVVITDECNLPEVRNTGAGWVCRPETGSVRDALRDLIRAGEAERAQRGALGRRLVEDRFNWAGIARDLDAAVEAIA